jgi:hypothetical protein
MADSIRRLSCDYQGGILSRTNRSLSQHVFRENTQLKGLNFYEKGAYRVPPFPNAYTGLCRVFCGGHPWILHSLESVQVNFLRHCHRRLRNVDHFNFTDHTC